MGIAKTAMIDAQERGWHELETHVCSECVDDPYLKQLIANNADSTTCDYCGAVTERDSAAPTDTITEAVVVALTSLFSDPSSAGVSYESREGGWLIEPRDTQDALLSLPFECHDDVFQDVADAILNDAWVEAAGGHWLTSQPHEEMQQSWDTFVHTLKHRVRYFFGNALASPVDYQLRSYTAVDVLRAIAEQANDIDIVRKLEAGTQLFRVRERKDTDTWEPDERTMGFPPPEMARAGRMNPAGISYFYLALDHNTACAEVLPTPPCRCAIAEFRATRDLRILDLTGLPDLPSLFDDSQRLVREAILFFASFVDSISQPIQKDGREHVEYVPSQVVCEYFALVYRTPDEHRLDGMIYPSSLRPSGRNLVLFPVERDYELKFDQVDYVSTQSIHLPTWDTITQMTGNGPIPHDPF